MTAEEIKGVLSGPLALFALMIIASLGNGVKQLFVVKQTGTPPKFSEYLAHWPETIGMLFGNTLAFVGLIMMDQLNYVSAISVGYGINSLMDMLPGKRSLSLKATPDDPDKIAESK